MAGLDLSVVIPVYRSQDTLRMLLGQLLAVLDGLGKDYEIIFVDDGSPDKSWDVLGELQRAHPGRVIAVQLMRNYGQHNALMCGLRHARGDYIITMDDDLQNPPAEIPRLLAAIEGTGADLVYGAAKVKKHPAWKKVSSVLVNLYFRTVFQCPVPVTSFRALRRRLVRSILPYSLNFTYIDGLLAWNTERVTSIPVEHHPRAKGKSRYSVRKLVVLALNLFTNFSLLPLQLVSAAGVLAAGLGFALGSYYSIHYLFLDSDVPNYARIIIAVLVLGGLQLLSLGIMGEYLGRLHLNVNRKPQYTVRHVRGLRPRRGGGNGVRRPHARSQGATARPGGCDQGPQ